VASRAILGSGGNSSSSRDAYFAQGGSRKGKAWFATLCGSFRKMQMSEPDKPVEPTAEEIRLQTYRSECDAAFLELFDAARQVEEVQFAAALNPEFRGMQDAGWSTATEAMQALDEYMELINELPLVRIKTRVALSLYSHLSEASGLYEVPKNMLRIASGDDYNLWPFQHLVERHRASGAIIAPNANKVMKDLLGHAGELKLEKLQKAILEAFDPELRNGYAHADYVIWTDGIRLRHRNGGQPRIVGFAEFTERLNKALTFFEILRENVDGAVLGYSKPKRVIGRMSKNGAQLPTIISYDEKKGTFSITSGPHL
jgi:hypothetical protein